MVQVFHLVQSEQSKCFGIKFSTCHNLPRFAIGYPELRGVATLSIAGESENCDAVEAERVLCPLQSLSLEAPLSFAEASHHADLLLSKWRGEGAPSPAPFVDFHC